MKFRAHETFFIRKGWINKGLRGVTKDGNIFISKEENPMDVLGIGSNMVKSLRYWLQAVGLTEEPTRGRRIQTLTDFGQLVYDHDRVYYEQYDFGRVRLSIFGEYLRTKNIICISSIESSTFLITFSKHLITIFEVSPNFLFFVIVIPGVS